MSVKLFEKHSKRKRIEEAGIADFAKGFLSGVAKSVGVNVETTEDWFEKLSLSPNKMSGWTTEALYAGKVNGNVILFVVNKNNEKLIYFMQNEAIVPMDYMPQIYSFWGANEDKMIKAIQKQYGYEIIPTLKGDSYTPLNEWLSDHNIHIFEWLDESTNYMNINQSYTAFVDSFNKSMISGSHNKQIEDIMFQGAAIAALDDSRLSDRELAELAGIEEGYATIERVDLCKAVVENIIKSQIEDDDTKFEEGEEVLSDSNEISGETL